MFRVSGPGFRDLGSGFGVLGSGLGNWFRDVHVQIPLGGGGLGNFGGRSALAYRISDRVLYLHKGFRVSGFGFGFRVSDRVPYLHKGFRV